MSAVTFDVNTEYSIYYRLGEQFRTMDAGAYPKVVTYALTLSGKQRWKLKLQTSGHYALESVQWPNWFLAVNTVDSLKRLTLYKITNGVYSDKELWKIESSSTANHYQLWSKLHPTQIVSLCKTAECNDEFLMAAPESTLTNYKKQEFEIASFNADNFPHLYVAPYTVIGWKYDASVQSAVTTASISNKNELTSLFHLRPMISYASTYYSCTFYGKGVGYIGLQRYADSGTTVNGNVLLSIWGIKSSDVVYSHPDFKVSTFAGEGEGIKVYKYIYGIENIETDYAFKVVWENEPNAEKATITGYYAKGIPNIGFDSDKYIKIATFSVPNLQTWIFEGGEGQFQEDFALSGGGSHKRKGWYGYLMVRRNINGVVKEYTASGYTWWLEESRLHDVKNVKVYTQNNGAVVENGGITQTANLDIFDVWNNPNGVYVVNCALFVVLVFLFGYIICMGNAINKKPTFNYK